MNISYSVEDVLVPDYFTTYTRKFRKRSLMYQNQPCHVLILVRHFLDTSRSLTLDELANAFYGHREDGGPLYAIECVHCAIETARKHLRDGWTIKCITNKQYYLHNDGEDQ